MNNKLKKFALLLGDILILYLSLYLTLLIRYWQQPSNAVWQNHLGPFSLIFLVWLIIFYIANLYNLHLAVNNSKFFKLSVRSISIAGLLSAVFFYLNPNIGIAPKTNLVIYIVIFLLFFILWRRFFNWSLKAYLPKDKLAIIGLNEQTRELIKTFENRPHLGYKIAFIFNEVSAEINNIPVITNILELKQFLEKEKISTIILATDPHHSPELRAALFKCLPLKINFVSLPNFYETAIGKVPIEAINQMWFLENLSEGKKAWFDLIKRGYDLILALLVVIITIIFWPILGLIIKYESGGPVFFKQPRLGKNNKLFTIIKFRTMTVSGNDYTPTKEKDSRITKLGGFLRKTRIDEIPQMINIIKGEMSFVGPRPERPELVKELKKAIPFYSERMLVKPGITGWDQISGECHSPSYEDTLKKLQYDLFYIKNRSIYLDLSIILKTIATVLSRKGI